MINEAFGWFWILVGFISGMVMGLQFAREDWLGGYQSHARRMLRLGHISFIGLGVLNILFAHTLERINLASEWTTVASLALIAGGVTMPVCCSLMAFNRRLTPIFAIPVLSLCLGGLLVVAGVIRS